MFQFSRFVFVIVCGRQATEVQNCHKQLVLQTVQVLLIINIAGNLKIKNVKFYNLEDLNSTNFTCGLKVKFQALCYRNVYVLCVTLNQTNWGYWRSGGFIHGIYFVHAHNHIAIVDITPVILYG